MQLVFSENLPHEVNNYHSNGTFLGLTTNVINVIVPDHNLLFLLALVPLCHPLIFPQLTCNIPRLSSTHMDANNHTEYVEQGTEDGEGDSIPTDKCAETLPAGTLASVRIWFPNKGQPQWQPGYKVVSSHNGAVGCCALTLDGFCI